MSYLNLLEQATHSITAHETAPPSSTVIRDTCLAAEKQARQDKPQYTFGQLLGTWRLCFITGTQKTRKRAGKIMGAGRYVPTWITISLTYQAVTQAELQSDNRGTIGNTVTFGPLQLSLSGPAQFISPKNIVAFDFTRMTVTAFGTQLYQGFVRGGKASEAQFYEQPVGKLAFFAYFLVGETIIAARGRGGGLALWGRV